MNHSLPGNPNAELNYALAVDYLVDAYLNTEDVEFVAATLRMHLRGLKTKDQVFEDLREAARVCLVSGDADFFAEVYDLLEANIRRLEGEGRPIPGAH